MLGASLICNKQSLEGPVGCALQPENLILLLSFFGGKKKKGDHNTSFWLVLLSLGILLLHTFLKGEFGDIGDRR